jgi:hypothetical protein
MTRRLATHAAAAAAGALLALLLTSTASSRQPSAPRPSAVILVVPSPVAPQRTEAPSPGVDASALPISSRSVEWPRKPSSSASHPSADGAETASVGASTPRPQPTTRPNEPRSGVASFVRASLGADYLAARLPRGTRLTVCGPSGCITGTVNDYGPSRKVFPERIVDLSAADFTRVCGPTSMGLCRVTVR